MQSIVNNKDRVNNNDYSIKVNNKGYANNYNDQQFSILAKARTSSHLAALEAIFIKSHKPELCRQKQFVFSLKISQ